MLSNFIVNNSIKTLNQANYDNMEESFFSLLENASNISNFCHGAEKILQQYVIKNLVIFSNQLTYNNVSKTQIIYTKIPLNVDDKIINKVNNIICNKLNINLTESIDFFPKCNLLSNSYIWDSVNQNNLYLFPITFKQKILGYLFIETEGIKSSQEEAQTLKLLARYLGLYVYNCQLEQREKTLIEKENKFKETITNQSIYLSHMNHELRTPVAAVIGFAKMLQQRLYGDLNSKQAQYVDAIYQSGTYLLELISDLLDISKIEARKEELFIEKVLIHELCNSSLALVKTKAEEQGLTLKIEIKTDIIYCFVDQRRIKQILVNLLSNGVKFTEKGTVTLQVTQDKDNLLFKVIDTGIGIDENSQKKLFSPFSQLNTHLHKKHRGSGLGLLISRELAKLHGGDITLTSEKDKGSCFTLILPLKNSISPS